MITFKNASNFGGDFAFVKNQKAVEAVMIAIAGEHNILLAGSPRSEKNEITKRIPSILPDLTKEESDEICKIYGRAGINPPTGRPFRTLRSDIGINKLCGEYDNEKRRFVPGEISFAHNGILCLNNAEEFRTTCLQLLIVPLENKRIRLSHAENVFEYPADLQLVLTANPCPCGNYGSGDHICLCSASTIRSYWKKLSSTLRDRMDIQVFLDDDNVKPSLSLYSSDIRKIIKPAMEMQLRRNNLIDGNHRAVLNGKLDSVGVGCIFETLSKQEKCFIGEASNCLTAKKYFSLLKVSRTIADIDGSKTIQVKHIEKGLNLVKDSFSIINDII